MPRTPIRDGNGKLLIKTRDWKDASYTTQKEYVGENYHGVIQDGTGEKIAECSCPKIAAFIIEAGTVTNQTGRTSAELRDERDAYKREVEVMQMERPSLDAAERKISELAALVRELRGALEQCRDELEVYEEECSGELYNSPNLNDLIVKAEAYL